MRMRALGLMAAALGGLIPLVLILGGCGDKGAAQQKQATEITKGIEDYLALIEVPGQPLRLRHDKVTVTPSEDGKSYLVAITGLRYGTETAAMAAFGEVDYRLTPEGDDQYQVGDLKMPNEVSVAGKDGKPEATVKFETTAFSAIWSKPLQNFLKFDWQVKDIVASAADQPGELFKIATASVTGDGKESGKGLLDQISKLTLSGFTATDPQDGTSFKLDTLIGNVSFEKLDFPAYRQMMAKINTFSTKYAQPTDGSAGGGATPDAPKLTEEDSKALADLVRGFPKLMSAYGYDFSAEGLTMTNARGDVLMHLTHGGLALGVKGIDTDHAEAHFGIQHDGLTVNGPMFEDPLARATLPTSGNLDLVMTDLPVPSLVESVAQAIPELTSADPQVAQGAQFMLMGGLMSALSQSTIKLRIDPSALETEKARLTADGELKLAMQTPQKAVGAVNFALVGLDDLMALATGLANENPEAAQAVQMMQMLQSLSQRETGGDGKPVDKFKLDLTEAGQVLVNGKSLEEIAP